MKEICGYMDEDGLFHKTEAECKLADARIKIHKIESKFDNFYIEVEKRIFKVRRNNNMGYNDRGNYDTIEVIKNEIYKSVAKYILSNSEEWQSIIQEKHELIEELDYLYANEKKGKWWLGINWWK